MTELERTSALVANSLAEVVLCCTEPLPPLEKQAESIEHLSLGLHDYALAIAAVVKVKP